MCVCFAIRIFQFLKQNLIFFTTHILLSKLVVSFSIMSQNNISLYYQNCRGTRTKLQSLYMNILSSSYDIIILTETWLTPLILDNEFIDNRYLVFRCDRDRALTEKQDGGGVLIAVKRELRPACIPLPSPAPAVIEHVIVAIPASQHNKQYLFSAAYIPPKTSDNIYALHFNILRDVVIRNQVKNFYVVGDYNLPQVEWVNSDTNGCGMIGMGADTCLSDFLSLTNSLQYNHLKNKSDRILDLIMSNQECNILPCDWLLPPDDYHPPFMANLLVNSHFSPMIRRPIAKFKYNSADYELINHELEKIYWDDTLNNLTVEEAVQKFYEIIYEIIRTHIPTAKSKSHHYPYWFSPALIRIFKDKERAWKKWKTYNNNCDYETFSIFRKRFKAECSRCYFNHIKLVEDSIPLNVKYFWTFVANRSTTTAIPATMYYKNAPSNDPSQISNLFSSFFQSVYEPSTLNAESWQPHSTLNSNSVLITDIYIDIDSITCELKKLDTSKGPGPDGLPVIFLKSTANTLAKPLHILYNKCLKEGIFPSLWKHAHITPVYKSGDKHNVENYRPISILSTLSKLFERLVHNIIYPILHNVIIPQQHGFVKRRSTTTNLMIFTNFLFKNMDCRLQVDAVYTDFQKCFDKVDHALLLQKIAFNGIRGNLLRWFVSYVTRRSQTVVINGFKSDTVNVSSGVPQGSILGPLLFNIFVNDIKSCFVHSNFLMYADDLKIFRTCKDPIDAELLQQDLNRFSNYCINNKLQLSLSKCVTITFTKNKKIIRKNYNLLGIDLKHVQIVKDLGVVLDSKLHLDQHINTIKDKALRMYGFVNRCSCDFKRPSTLLFLYKSLIRSQLEYAVPISNPIYDKYVQALERIQRKFLRNVNFKYRRVRKPYTHLLADFKLLSLENRRILLSTMTLHKICNNKFDCIDLSRDLCYVVPRTVRRRAVRAPQLFHLPRCRSHAGTRAPLRRLTDMFNKICSNLDIFADSECNFKRNVIDILSNN